FADLDLEQKNVRTALEMAAQLGQTADFIAGVLAFYLFWEAKGLYDVAGAYLARVAGQRPEEAVWQMRLHHYQGRLAQRQGEYIEAEDQFEMALELARTLEAEEELSHLLRALGVLAARRGDYVLADVYYKEGLELAKSLGHGGIVSNFLRGLG